jgi:hypothetical protein
MPFLGGAFIGGTLPPALDVVWFGYIPHLTSREAGTIFISFNEYYRSTQLPEKGEEGAILKLPKCKISIAHIVMIFSP